MSKELPSSWMTTRMVDIVDYAGGSQPPKNVFIYEPKKGYVRLLQIRDFGNKPFPTYVPDSPKLKKVSKSDILIARYGGSSGNEDSLGRICSGLEGAYNVALTKLIFNQELLDKDYIKYLFMGPWFKSVVGSNIRSCQTGFNKEDIKQVNFPLAPLNEQKRISQRLNQILPIADICSKRLEKIPNILKCFRQSVLVSALTGRLTENWRLKNKYPETTTNGSMDSKGSYPEIDSDIFKNSSTYDIPPSWSFIPLGRLGSIVGGGTPSKENSKYWEGDIPWVSPKDMKTDRIKDSIDHISEDAIKNSSAKKIPRGSILFVVRGMILNHTFPVAITDVEVTINQDMKALVPENNLLSEYLLLASKFIAGRVLFEVKEATHGTRRLETEILKYWAIPIPPSDEQREIVNRVQKLFHLAAHLEAQHQKAEAHVNKLTQSILLKAFRGELLEQNPADEPASVLLERIMKSKEVLVAKPNRRFWFDLKLGIGAVLENLAKTPYPRGEMVIAKMMFFLQEVYRVPFGLRFVPQQFGPYDANIKKAILGSAFGKDKFFQVNGRGDTQVYGLGVNANQLFKYNSHTLAQSRTALKDLMSRIGQMKSVEIELLASVCKVIQDYQIFQVNDVFNKLSEWKPGRFTVDEVNNALHRIKSWGWDSKLLTM